VDKLKIEDVTLKMWEKTMLPESEKIDGKYVKTGRKEEATTLTFIDSFGDKLVFVTSNNKYRELEGQVANLWISVGYDSFNKKNKIQFKGFLN